MPLKRRQHGFKLLTLLLVLFLTRHDHRGVVGVVGVQGFVTLQSTGHHANTRLCLQQQRRQRQQQDEPSSGSSSSSSNSSSESTLKWLDRRSAIVTAGAVVASLVSLSTTMPTNAVQAKVTVNTIPKWILEDGVSMPTLALNTVGLSVEQTKRAVGYAVEAGMTHIDFHPGKERDGVAAYLKEYPEQRDDLFLNTKIRKAPPGTSPENAAERTRQQIDDDLQALGVPAVDMLMLRDSPDCLVIQAQWSVLEDALRAGKTRSIGVINFCQQALSCLLETSKVKPALNYYMLHVGMGRDAHGLRTFGESRGIRTFAYGAIGEPGPNPELLSSTELKRIGKAHQKSPEQVALRWVLQTGAAASVRPTTSFDLGVGYCDEGSKCKLGIQARANSYDWILTEKEMAELDVLSSPDDNPTLFSSAGCPGAFVMPPK